LFLIPVVDRLSGQAFIALLSIAAAAFVVWQTFHFGVLWDFSFLIDNAYRIARGDIPYRDYPLAWPPGTFFVQAILISIFGRSYAVHVTYCAIVNAASLWITWQILRVIHARDAAARDWRAALWCFPLIPLGVYSIYFHPWYDSDCIFAVLVGLLGLCRLATGRSSQLGAFLFGMSWAAPVLIKQNIGLPVLFCFVGCGALGSLGFFELSVRKGFIAALSGTAVALAGVFIFVHSTVGVATYFYWTFEHAWKVRGGDAWKPFRVIWHTPPAVVALTMVALGWVVLLTSSGQRLVWRWLGILLLAIPIMTPLFVGSTYLPLLFPAALVSALVAAMCMLRVARLQSVSLMVCLAAAWGALYSQGFWSTFALGPLLVVMLSSCFLRLGTEASATISSRWLEVGLVALLFALGVSYALGRDRLSYAGASSPLPIHRATWAPMRGFSAPGPYLDDLKELVDFFHTRIPTADHFMAAVGEDPLYFILDRKPAFPVLQFDPTTNPFPVPVLLQELSDRQIRWVILKRRTQLVVNPWVGLIEFARGVERNYECVAQLRNYKVYRLRQPM
jgi:hypothetical protein